MKPILLTIAICLFVSQQAFTQKKSAQTKVIAHRGAWKNTGFPQNSIASLKAAIAMGCFASECDIWMTSDSVLVVNHDPEFYGLTIEKLTYKELLNKKHPNGESLPTLQDFVAVMKQQKHTRLVLDIKPSKISKERSVKVAEKTYRMVNDLKAQKITDYILFDYDACLALRKLDQKIKISYLNGDKSPEEVAADKLYGLDYNFKIFQRNEHWLKQAQERKLTLNVWTVNDKDLMKWFIAQKVDFITTDEPELLLQVVKQ